MYLKKVFILSLLIFIVFTFSTIHQKIAVSALSFTVNSTLDINDINPGDGICETQPGNGVCTLRAAISEANTTPVSDTITLPAGTFAIALTGTNENTNQSGDFDISQPLIIQGAGQSQTIIDGGGIDRIFDVNPQNNTTNVISSSFSNLTLQNGSITVPLEPIVYSPRIDAGSAIRGIRSNVTVERVTFQNNSSIAEGALAVAFSTIEVSNSRFNGNTATTGGGISLLYPGISNITNTVFTNNIVTGSGGAFAFIGNGTNSVRINSSIVENNTAQNGGGIYHCEIPGTGGLINSIDDSLYITDTLISNNTASNNGGGIQSCGGHLQLLRSLVENNTAVNNGGGISVYDEIQNILAVPYTSNIELLNSTMYGNSSQVGGAASLVLGQTTFPLPQMRVFINNSTIARNTTSNSSSAALDVNLYNGQYSVSNSIVAENTGGNCTPLPDLELVSYDFTKPNLTNDESCRFTLQNQSPNFGTYGVNGAANGLRNLPLTQNSAAVNSGDQATCLSNDQLSSSRPFYSICDLGAVEYRGVLNQNSSGSNTTNNNTTSSNTRSVLIRTGGSGTLQ
jgi:CSLREA domain-containing protein